MLNLLVWLGSAGWVLAAEQVILLPETIPTVQYLYAAALSVWGCLAANVQRWARADDKGNRLAMIAADFFCSTSAGLIVFFGALHLAAPPYLAAISIFVAGYGGSKLLEKLYERFEKKIDEVKP